MPEDFKKAYDKHKDKLHIFILIFFAYAIGKYFWVNIRPKIVLSSCNEIALSTSHIQARTSVFIDTSEAYEFELNECLIKSGVVDGD